MNVCEAVELGIVRHRGKETIERDADGNEKSCCRGYVLADSGELLDVCDVCPYHVVNVIPEKAGEFIRFSDW